MVLDVHWIPFPSFETDWLTERQTERQTDRQTDRETDRQTNLMIVTNCDIVSSCGTRNFVLSRTGKLTSLWYLSTMTWNIQNSHLKKEILKNNKFKRHEIQVVIMVEIFCNKFFAGAAGTSWVSALMNASSEPQLIQVQKGQQQQ